MCGHADAAGYRDRPIIPHTVPDLMIARLTYLSVTSIPVRPLAPGMIMGYSLWRTARAGWR
jgi:hypothetical protein